ncbi:hypothetical protein [Streptomyces odontomachi]|uniref:hypothetical protein n=1 Tax=Streptomyces odontomachi TaxID=2944940 RepID=UPI00210A688D|nr:hypothetical protein [Streptomyces sp. ODS25]
MAAAFSGTEDPLYDTELTVRHLDADAEETFRRRRLWPQGLTKWDLLQDEYEIRTIKGQIVQGDPVTAWTLTPVTH